MLAEFTKLSGSASTVTTRTGTVIVDTWPENIVPKSQAKLVSPEAPVQVPSAEVGAPVKIIPDGRLSETSTSSASPKSMLASSTFSISMV